MKFKCSGVYSETVEFILRIANEVEKLSMSMQPMAPVWLIKEILRRKVYDLNVFAHAKSSCSLKEVENFIKVSCRVRNTSDQPYTQLFSLVGRKDESLQLHYT